MPEPLKTYVAPWNGQLILACKKCQKKLKGDKKLAALAKLRKTAKRLNKEHRDAPVFVVNVPCMDLCPKHGVTACCPGRNAAGLVILRSEEDLRTLAEWRE